MDYLTGLVQTYLVVFISSTLYVALYFLLVYFFSCSQPRPWLALTLAVPYLIIVVALGYSRQSVAIGIELVALLFLQQNKLFHFMGLIAVASTFHRTVLVLLVLPASTLSANLRFSQLIRILLLSGSAYGLYTSILSPPTSIII